MGPVRHRSGTHCLHAVRKGGMVVCSGSSWKPRVNSGRADVWTIGGVFSASASVEIFQELAPGRRLGRRQCPPRQVAADGLLRPCRRSVISLFLVGLQVEEISRSAVRPRVLAYVLVTRHIMNSRNLQSRRSSLADARRTSDRLSRIR
jgi:hypothetical protein